ncbi:MAG: nucleotide sugar dehydrogenase [Actinomycetota bacterium]
MTAVDDILTSIERWTWTAGVLGLGYVGLPLVVTMSRAGIPVTGFDVDGGVIPALAEGRSHIDDVSDEDLTEASERTRFTASPEDLRSADVLFICVPTPLAVGKQPDMTYIEGAARVAASVLRPGHTVILESTTYPGTTQDVVLPILATSGLKLDEDFLLAYSPERVDPGNPSFRTANIPRVVGGASPTSTRAAASIYRRFVEKVHPVSDARTAEMAKLVENTFRWVNIALANELSSVARAFGVNIWEVIEAAATKPFGYMPFYPGPGVGGHCIPLDPFYLQWAARRTGEGTRFIELAEWVNARMPQVVVARVIQALNARGVAMRDAGVVVLGVSYKPNVKDYRESPAIECMRNLLTWDARVSYVDPFVPELTFDEQAMEAVPLTREVVSQADVVLILCDHDAIDFELVARNATLIVDTRNALRRRSIDSENLILL